jgi:hypothetical protein
MDKTFSTVGRRTPQRGSDDHSGSAKGLRRGVLKAQFLEISVILIILTACDVTMAADTGTGVAAAASSPVGAESAENDGDAPIKDEDRNELSTTGAGVQWKDEAQKTRCQTYLTQLYDCLYKARSHYLRGDPCKSAAQTTLFLEVAEKCRKDCPEGILEAVGYSRRIMRNVSWLRDLNTKRCKFVNSTQPDPSKSPDKIFQPNSPVRPDTETPR